MLSTVERISLRNELIIIFESYHIQRANKQRIISLLSRNNNHLQLYNLYINQFRSEDEALYNIFHKTDLSEHMCPYCNKPNKFYIKMKKYRDTCGSNKCSTAKTTSSNSKKKRQNTMKELYEHEHALQVPKFQKKAQDTCLKHFGKDNPRKVQSIIDKSNITRINNLIGNDNSFIEDIDIIEVINQLKTLYNISNNLEISQIYVNDSMLEFFIKLLCSKKNRKLLVNEIASIFHLNTGTIRKRCIKLDIYSKYFITQEIKLELQLMDFLDKNHIQYKTHYRIPYIDKDNHNIRHSEIDIFIEDYNIGIEVNDLDSHNILRKNKDYHYNKTLIALSKGIRLIHLWEWELTNELLWNKVSNWLLSLLLGKDIIKVIDSYNIQCISYNKNVQIDFFNKYSLDRYKENDIAYGLYYKNELINILTFKVLQSKQYELVQLCTKFNYQIDYNLLLNQFILDYHPDKIITCCCLDKDDIQSYINLNFKLIDKIEPSLIHFNKDINRIIDNNHDSYSNYQSIYNCGYYIYERGF